jgi:nicotinamidase-related amidase
MRVTAWKRLAQRELAEASATNERELFLQKDKLTFMRVSGIWCKCKYIEEVIDMENNSALLIMDIQGRMVDGLANKDEYLQKIQRTIDAARANTIPVIYVVVGFRPNMPEFNPRSKGLRALRDTGVADALVNPIPVLTLTETDVVVTRRRLSAFTGSDLEILLRTKNIDHLVLTGISTSGVVLSTLREAVDKDYILTVVSDLCADRDEEVHRVLTEKVFPRHADVLSSTEWLSTLRSA